MNNKIFKFILVLLITLIFYSHILLAQTQEGVVKSVIDGNTVELDTGQTVRYIGVAVPDLTKPDERFGKESLEFNRNLVEGKKIKLEYDEKVKDNELVLACVHQDSVFVNAEIIKQG
jgi:micrococcal nuclease